MTIKMLQNARNWAAKHQKFACGWVSTPDPVGDFRSPDPLKWPTPFSNSWVRHCVQPIVNGVNIAMKCVHLSIHNI